MPLSSEPSIPFVLAQERNSISNLPTDSTLPSPLSSSSSSSSSACPLSYSSVALLYLTPSFWSRSRKDINLLVDQKKYSLALPQYTKLIKLCYSTFSETSISLALHATPSLPSSLNRKEEDTSLPSSSFLASFLCCTPSCFSSRHIPNHSSSKQQKKHPIASSNFKVERTTSFLTRLHQCVPSLILKELSKTYCRRSQVYLHLNLLAQAYEDASWAIALTPTLPKPYYRLGMAALALEKFNEAKEAFQKVCQFNSKGMKFYDDVKMNLQFVESILQDEKNGFRIVQLLPGKDYCIATSFFSPLQRLIKFFAEGMQNCIYLIIDLASRQALVVDPCWDTESIVHKLQQYECELKGIILGHTHFDHTGGLPPKPFPSLNSLRVPGVFTLLQSYKTFHTKRQKKVIDLKWTPLPIYVHPLDLPLLKLNDPDLFDAKLDADRCFRHEKQIQLGSTRIELLHLPGHTPGSQVILVHHTRLLTSDVLFCQGMGRTDLPGGNANQMKQSLRQLQKFPNEVVVYPGHHYHDQWFTTIANEKLPGGGLHELSWESI